jgi:two-component system sensor histidine kinase BaeS
LTLAIIGVVTLALVLSGAVTLLLVRRAARDETRRELVRQAEDLAVQADDAATFRALAQASRALQLDGLSRVTFSRGGSIVEGALPEGVMPSDLPTAELREGRSVSGVRGGLAYAAVGVTSPAAQRRPVSRPSPFIAVVLTRRVDSGLARGGRWFVLASILALAIAAAVAERLGRRITAPLAAAESATRRIADGDLAARVDAPTDPNVDPELASLVSSINTMAANLERSRGLERQFLLAVSHDLRTPLTSIRGFAEAIADGATTDHRHAASVITAESRRLERLVADLLELARLDARRFSLDVRTIDAAEVVAVTAEGFRPEVDELGLALEIDVGSVAVLARADPDRLAQVVANLVENALKFASTRITVDVADDVEADTVLLVVGDDGPGIDESDLTRVFERFATSDRASARRSGTGLGLAIVAELVRAMGGEVRATGTTTGSDGTRMEVRLQRA